MLQQLQRSLAILLGGVRLPGGAMVLDNLRYGSFRAVAVQVEGRALPGYGGQVEDWGTYRFMVEALGMKESQLSESESRKSWIDSLPMKSTLHGTNAEGKGGCSFDTPQIGITFECSGVHDAWIRSWSLCQVKPSAHVICATP